MIPQRFTIVCLLILALASCDPLVVYDRFKTTDNGNWRWNDVAVFEVEMNDTVTLHDVYLQVRHSIEYPMSNLYMFVHVKGPAGQHFKDTVNLVLALPDGRWTGKGTGKLRELRLLYRKNILFSEPGIYTFSIEQAMRKAELPVTDVGVRIVRANR